MQFKKSANLIVTSAITPKSKLNGLTTAFDFSKGNKCMANTPKANYQGFNFMEIIGPDEAEEEENSIKKFLRVKELKLKEKEEEFEKEREKVLNTWKKMPMANELIPMVQKEILELRDIKERFRRKIEIYERKEFEMAKGIEEVKKQEKEAREKQKDSDDLKRKLEEDKANLIFKLERLREEIEKP